ncbi:hypothetical protein LEP1GSC065_3305, partial [Leptospira kirschneri serovar Sokoine str. RM1]
MKKKPENPSYGFTLDHIRFFLFLRNVVKRPSVENSDVSKT